MDHKMQILLGTVRRLLRRRALDNIEKILAKTHPADIAHLFQYLSQAEHKIIFSLIKDPEKAALTLSLADEPHRITLLGDMEINRILGIIHFMPADDTAEILSLLPEETSNEILERMKKEESEDIEMLLTSEENTAGRIMVTDFLALNQEITAAEAIKSFQDNPKTETVFYIYVIDDFSHLLGVVSLRGLLTCTAETPLKKLMEMDIIRVKVDTDQEEVARIVAKYDILAVPVVDDNNTLVGIITVDDIIDIIREEATEDIYRLAGTDDEEIVYGERALMISKIRLPWLLTTLVGGLLSGYLLWIFKATLKEILALVSFVPVIMAMAGNVGIQSTLIVVRGFATGRMDMNNIKRMILKEFKVGIIMGVVCGTLVGIAALIWHGGWFIGLVVGSSMVISVTIAALLGSFIPTILKVLKFDPAIASGPFVTTINDITALLIYLSSAVLLLKYVFN